MTHGDVVSASDILSLVRAVSAAPVRDARALVDCADPGAGRRANWQSGDHRPTVAVAAAQLQSCITLKFCRFLLTA
jgi:hypothetical protein